MMDEPKRFFGIDPGLKGALAIINESGQIVSTHRMPVRKDGLLDHEQIFALLNTHPRAPVYLERALAFGMGVTGAFNYGRNFGILEATIERTGRQINYVYPTVWTKLLHKGVLPDQIPKVRSLAVATDLFGIKNLPKLRTGKAHDGIVDALLIAEFGRRQSLMAS